MIVFRGHGQALRANRLAIFFAKRKVIQGKLMKFRMIAGPSKATCLVDGDVDEGVESDFPHILVPFYVTSVFTVAVPKMEHRPTDTSQIALAVAVSSLSPFLIMTKHRLALVVICPDAETEQFTNKTVCHQIIAIPKNRSVIKPNVFE